MRKAIGTVIGFSLLAWVCAEIYIEKSIYIDITRDCSVYKNKDRKQYMGCWRSKRYAHYTLKKRLGHYEKYKEQMVGKVGYSSERLVQGLIPNRGEEMSKEEEYVSVNAENYLDVVDSETRILEPRETYDKGIVGYRPKEKKLVYALSLLIGALVEDNDWEYEEAVDWLYYNTMRSCEYGEYSPIILEDTFSDEW